ncbi:hypothetical protein ACFQ61_09460 [Streptomyces sp. NPDC056500]|uniref:hypothetical protein n=1 Tax=Streptomyces sp. NPDC056500 TaxID=3345840 RepID=UPI00367571C4
MRRRSTTVVLGLATLALTVLPGCSTSSSTPATAASAPAGSAKPKTASDDAKPTNILTSAQLRGRLLDEGDLGQGYTREPEQEFSHDDVTVIGCPALEQLGGDAATGGSFDFANKAEAAFTYEGSTDSEVGEELYSDTETKLCQGTGRIFDAMVSCPTYQIVAGSTPVKITTQKLTAPALGDEQWSQLLTFTAGGQSSVFKQTAIRSGTLLVIISGPPGLVDTHIDKALTKAESSSWPPVHQRGPAAG